MPSRLRCARDAGMLTRNPEERMGRADNGKEIMAHEFFSGQEWEDLLSKARG